MLVELKIARVDLYMNTRLVLRGLGLRGQGLGREAPEVKGLRCGVQGFVLCWAFRIG